MIPRREFLQMNAILLLAGGRLGGEPRGEWGRGKLLAGIQAGPVDLLDEGLERALDFMQEEAGVNAVFCYSQTYHLGEVPGNILARDHPVAPRDPAGRVLPDLWMRLPEERFADLAVRHPRRKEGVEYGERDVFAELAEPCRRRGIRLYARILEASNNRADKVPGYLEVTARDLEGKPVGGPCWNHPEYREWIRRTIEEMMKGYALDGLQYGAERAGPLADVLWRGAEPGCFCRFCEERNARAGVEAARAREGYRQLRGLMAGVEKGDPKPVDGVLVTVIRILSEYPEVLAWNREWYAADGEIQKMVYATAKAVRPEADVGQHVDHQRSSWDVFYRASAPYGKLAEHNDFIKPILYHEIYGPRLREWVIDRMRKGAMGDFSADLALEAYYAVFGLEAKAEPDYEALAEKGLTPDYVYRETKRCVEGVGGKARVYAGIGLDVPHYVPGGMKPMPSDPEAVYAATLRAVEAGAAGVLASREYREMRRPSLAAFGRAVRSLR